jgi:hypothetical protein
MKRIISTALFLATASMAIAQGGYLGKRVIVGVQAAYAPRLVGIVVFLTQYDASGGARLGFIVGRYSQLDLQFNYSNFGGNHHFSDYAVKQDRITSMQFGAAWKQFVSKKGGLAPIGRFWEIQLNYGTYAYKVDGSNLNSFSSDINVLSSIPGNATALVGSIGYGVQNVLKDRFVWNVGVRCGGPLYYSTEGNHATFYGRRILYREMINVFGGFGILL